MKTTLTIFLLAVSARAVTYDTLTWDSSVTNAPAVIAPAGVYLVDVAESNRVKKLNPEFRPWMVFPSPPRLWNRAKQQSIPWTGTMTGSVAAAKDDADKQFNRVQREGERAMKSIRTALSLPPKADPLKVLRVALDASLTNSANSATRTLAQAGAAYLLLQQDAAEESP